MMLRLLLIVVATLCACRGLAACEPATLLAGHWQSAANAKGTYWQEHWTALDSDNWQGVGLTLNQRGDERGREDLRLVRMGGTWFYLAKVSQNPLPVAFALTECTASRLLFTNPAHDFPKQLLYQGDTNSLLVDVSDGAGKGFQLNFQRMPRP